MAGLPTETDCDRIQFLALRKYTPDERIAIIETAIYGTEGLGLVLIDGIRDLVYDINSPGEATCIISKLMQWTDERLIDEFVLYMEKYGYMKKTINKNLAVFSAMLNTAFKEGYRFKTSVLDHFPKLHVTREDKVVEIYLTEEELQTLYEMPLTGKEDNVRDVFIVGCYTSQRYSDYSHITKRNIAYVLSLIEEHVGENGEIDDDIAKGAYDWKIEKYESGISL